MTDNSASNLVDIVNPASTGNFVLVCEHASNSIPQELNNLGLNEEIRQSHIAWDPGADAVSRILSESLQSPLVSSRVSRLVYDCNRRQGVADAIPARSEIYEVPGNAGLSDDQRAQRLRDYYLPFEEAVGNIVANAGRDKALVTIHSFTPVYFHKPRTLEIGLIHDTDPRLAEQMFEVAADFSDLSVALNQPYSMEDDTTHTLNLHGTRNGLVNIMIEIRNDLIATSNDQVRIAEMLGNWLSASMEKLNLQAGT